MKRMSIAAVAALLLTALGLGGLYWYAVPLAAVDRTCRGATGGRGPGRAGIGGEQRAGDPQSDRSVAGRSGQRTGGG